LIKCCFDVEPLNLFWKNPQQENKILRDKTRSFVDAAEKFA
jgi:hypothetical protein